MTTTEPQPSSLPAVAQSRLAHDNQGGAAATAFLEYADYLNLGQMGFEPIAGVVGIAVVHLGRVQLGGYKQAIELEVYSQGIGMGIYASLGRLQEEARLLGADGVIVDNFEERRVGEEHEYTFSGTAVRFAPRPGALRTTGGLPFIHGDGVICLYEMMRLNLAPVTFGFGVCVYHVPHRSMRQAMGQAFQNTEVPQFTEAWYSAREIGLSRLQSYLENQGAELVLNMDILKEADFFGEHTVEFRVTGMGWRRFAGLSQLVPEVDLRPAALIEKGLVVIGADGSFAAPGQPAGYAPPPPEPPEPPESPDPPPSDSGSSD
jgi:uncharacterized protein YbjQ (UPF0145 family)